MCNFWVVNMENKKQSRCFNAFSCRNLPNDIFNAGLMNSTFHRSSGDSHKQYLPCFTCWRTQNTTIPMSLSWGWWPVNQLWWIQKGLFWACEQTWRRRCSERHRSSASTSTEWSSVIGWTQNASWEILCPQSSCVRYVLTQPDVFPAEVTLETKPLSWRSAGPAPSTLMRSVCVCVCVCVCVWDVLWYSCSKTE